MRNVFLTNRLFWMLGAVAALFVLSFPFRLFFPAAQALFFLALAVVAADFFLLFSKKNKVDCRRTTARLLSLSDPNPIHLQLKNRSPRPLGLILIDEIPFQFQKRDFEIQFELAAGEERTLEYELTPKTRGEYAFGNVLVYAETKIGLLQRRFICPNETVVPVYPSILQMKKFELRAFDRLTLRNGLKQIRRLGHTYEFEQIKEYVRGDDYRSVNWKATSRKQGLMVNQYTDERSQEVYCLLDKSRAMRMPFDGLTLLDYAINAALVLSNIILQKYDKAGMLTFSDKIGSFHKADRKTHQLAKILETLYKEREHPLEANYELMYHAARKLIPQRSLLLLFTNFESNYALDRVLPLLRRISKFHLLVVIFFENTEINDFAMQEAKTLEGIYTQAVAQKFVAEKSQMVQKLHQFGIQCILTRPQDLTINSVNKYLEIKARGMI